MKKLIPFIILSIIALTSLYYGYINALKVKRLEQKLADYEIEFNNVVIENEEYKKNIENLESRLNSIGNVLRINQ